MSEEMGRIREKQGVLGIATCDKGLPAMMMALAGTPDKPTIIMPGGVTLAVENGEDTAKIQSIGSRFAQNEVTLEYAQDVGCRSCASPGGGSAGDSSHASAARRAAAAAATSCAPTAAWPPCGRAFGSPRL